jgi:GNAT superfamily N-acetyltransferase
MIHPERESTSSLHVFWYERIPGQLDKVEIIDPGKGYLNGFYFHPQKRMHAMECEVEPQWQRQGVGTRMLERMLDEAKKKGATSFSATATSIEGLSHLTKVFGEEHIRYEDSQTREVVEFSEVSGKRSVEVLVEDF